MSWADELRRRDEAIARLTRDCADFKRRWQEMFDVRGCDLASTLWRSWAAHQNFSDWQRAKEQLRALLESKGPANDTTKEVA